MLTDRRQVRQPGIPIAVSVVPFLREGREAVRDDSKMAGSGDTCPPREENYLLSLLPDIMSTVDNSDLTLM